MKLKLKLDLECSINKIVIISCKQNVGLYMSIVIDKNSDNLDIERKKTENCLGLHKILEITSLQIDLTQFKME